VCALARNCCAHSNMNLGVFQCVCVPSLDPGLVPVWVWKAPEPCGLALQLLCALCRARYLICVCGRKHRKWWLLHVEELLHPAAVEQLVASGFTVISQHLAGVCLEGVWLDWAKPPLMPVGGRWSNGTAVDHL
jgi:hypothetical protein